MSDDIGNRGPIDLPPIWQLFEFVWKGRDPFLGGDSTTRDRSRMEDTMTAAVRFLRHIPTAASEFALMTAFSFVGLVLSIALACYGVGFTAPM